MGSKKRDIFGERVEGLEAMREHRERKVTLRTYEFAQKPAPQVDAAFVRDTRTAINMSQAVFANFCSGSLSPTPQPRGSGGKLAAVQRGVGASSSYMLGPKRCLRAHTYMRRLSVTPQRRRKSEFWADAGGHGKSLISSLADSGLGRHAASWGLSFDPQRSILREDALRSARADSGEDEDAKILEGSAGGLLARTTRLRHSDSEVPLQMYWEQTRRGGECQGSCRLTHHAAMHPPSVLPAAILVRRVVRTGLRRTVSTGVQFRVSPLQRSGLRALAA